MRVYVNGNCIGCGMCPNVCPGVFHMTDANVAEAIEAIPPEAEAQVHEARDSCPTDAIIIEEE
jgi:ferredoxin